jgi:hypothetical protein
MKTWNSTLLALVAATTACFNWGTRPKDFEPAMGPRGARVALRVRGESADRLGELIAVDSAGITIDNGKFVRIAWARVDALDVAQLGRDYDIRFGEEVTQEKRARLALVSRFPQGLARIPIPIDSLITDARIRSSRYEDRRVAVEEGYRRVGADFPAMGEHWLNVPTLLAGHLDPAKPTFLVYADVRGQPTLLGVGFAFISHGDSLPAHLPGWPERWHEHSGLLADESGAVMTRETQPSRTHLWVMHAWTRLDNPDGEFAAENWALPYLRAGRATPHHLDGSAARALSLTVGGDEFFRGLLTDAGFRPATTAARIDSLIASARAHALEAANDQELGRVWSDFQTTLAAISGPQALALLRPAHAALEAHR